MPYAPKTRARVLMAALAVTTFAVYPSLAEAQRVRGGARASVSRPSGGGFSGGGMSSRSSSMHSRPSAGTRPSTGGANRPANAGNRTTNSNRANTANSGNRINNSDRGGNRVNNGNINSGNNNRINTGDINRNVNIDADGGWGNRDWDDRPIAAGVAFGAAAAITAGAIGSMYYALPPACSPYPYGGYSYYNCGGVYYQPQYEGDTVVYVTVEEPR